MENNTRKKILWALAIIILLIVFIFWILRTSDESNNVNNNTNVTPPTFTPPSAKLEYQPSETVEESPTEFSVINLARSYTARFGSWSTDTRGDNLNELLPLSTTKMQNYLRSIDINSEVTEFSGITTKSLSAKILNVDDNSAQVLVNTQRINTNASLEKDVYYQEAEVKMLKSSDKWLVDQFTWK